MPIYEYQCESCDQVHEIIQKISDAPLQICPACGGTLQKKLSLSGFQLKGGGWYKDGYSSSGGASATSKKEPAAGDAGKSTPTPPSAAAGSVKKD